MNSYIRVRLSEEEKLAWQKRAESSGVSMSKLVRDTMNGDVVITDKREDVVITAKDKSVKEAIAKCKKLEGDYKVRNKRENEFRSYFKDKKLNER